MPAFANEQTLWTDSRRSLVGAATKARVGKRSFKSEVWTQSQLSRSGRDLWSSPLSRHHGVILGRPRCRGRSSSPGPLGDMSFLQEGAVYRVRSWRARGPDLGFHPSSQCRLHDESAADAAKNARVVADLVLAPFPRRQAYGFLEFAAKMVDVRKAAGFGDRGDLGA